MRLNGQSPEPQNRTNGPIPHAAGLSALERDGRGAEAVSCALCAHAAAHGWWGPSIHTEATHCDRCHRTWTGAREAHCAGGGPNEPGCCAHFSTPANFAAHIRTGRCVDPASLANAAGVPRFKVVERASGPVWVEAGERESAWS